VVPPVGDSDLSAGDGERAIVLNGRVAARVTVTGVERWAIELAPRLKALAPRQYVELRPTPSASSGMAGQLWEQTTLPAKAARMRASLVFSPANLAPLAWPRNVIMVHDAAPFRRPEAYSRMYRSWHRQLGAACARRALRVVTVSEFSKRELVELLGLHPEVVTVIRGGVDERFTPNGDRQRVPAKLGLDRPYVLTIGTDDQRKNLAALSVAAERLGRSGFDIIRAGDARPHFSGTSAVTGVRSIGYVEEDDLPGLYRAASAFVLPSVYEGLGLPCLEAMACGVPVVAADRAALPETCGPAAVLVDPDDPVGIADALGRVVEDAALRARLRETGLSHAAGYSWDRAASELHGLLLSLAGPT
jgi:glycosyltransferase involved in cell wall biosynthesis